LLNPNAKGPQTLATKMSLRLGRPGNYRLESERDVGARQFKAAVWNSGAGDLVQSGKTAIRVKSRQDAFNSALPYPETLGTIVAALFFGDTNSPATEFKDYSRTNDETINAQKCYVLMGRLGTQKATFWINRADFTVVKWEIFLGRKVADSELVGLDYSKQVRIKRAAALRGNFTETFQDIQVSKPLNPSDFESSFPPTANLPQMH
jgi:hypothetical protein